MKMTIELDPSAALFYTRAAALCGKSLPETLSDTLFVLAGELSLEALQNARKAGTKNNSEKPL